MIVAVATVRRSSFVVRCSSFVVRRSSFVVRRSSLLTTKYPSTSKKRKRLKIKTHYGMEEIRSFKKIDAMPLHCQ